MVRFSGWARAAVALGALSSAALAKEPAQASRDEGVFKIFVGGREVGREKFTLAMTADGGSSSSVLDFKDLTGSVGKLHFESRLEMEPNYHPRTYRLQTEVGGQRGEVSVSFSPGQVMFEYAGRGRPVKRGLLVGAEATMLDTNMFHHFIFLVRRFDAASGNKAQRFEVVVAQEYEAGFLEVRELGRETLALGRRTLQARHLRVDSGAKQIDLWVDRHGVVRKIAVAAQQIEVVREP